MIFGQLSACEILESTLVSPKANKIISKSVWLMQSYRFKIKGHPSRRISRKYTKIDFSGVKSNRIFEDISIGLTEVTFHDCTIKIDVFQVLLSNIVDTLKLLIIDNCVLFYGFVSSYLKPRQRPTPLFFPNLKTLIFVDSTPKTRYTVLSIIRASSLTELGMVDIRHPWIYWKTISKMFFSLIRNNPELKRLHVPILATDYFLKDAIENNENNYNLEELSLIFYPFTGFFQFSERVLDFLETQRSTLKCLQLGGCNIEENQAVRLLSLKLVRLELHRCTMTFSPNAVIENSSMKSLSLISFCSAHEWNPDAIYNFTRCCLNLCALEAFIIPIHNTTFPGSIHTLKFIDTFKMLPDRISWSDIRSLRYAGVAYTIEYVRENRDFYYFQQKLKEISLEEHPQSIIQWKAHNYTRLAAYRKKINAVFKGQRYRKPARKPAVF